MIDPDHIVVADGRRARIFSVERTDEPGEDPGPTLVERESLVNPDASTTGAEAVTDPRAGRGRAFDGGPSHRLGDQADGRQLESRRRFAKAVAGRITRSPGRSMLLVADPRMLGILRPELEASGARVTERPEDLTRLTTPEIHDHLARHGALSPRPRPGSEAPC